MALSESRAGDQRGRCPGRPLRPRWLSLWTSACADPAGHANEWQEGAAGSINVPVSHQDCSHRSPVTALPLPGSSTLSEASVYATMCIVSSIKSRSSLKWKINNYMVQLTSTVRKGFF